MNEAKPTAATDCLTSTDPYSIGCDFTGPLYFVPQQCIEKFSFQLPSVTMPIIALVGAKPYNAASQMMEDYLTTLVKL